MLSEPTMSAALTTELHVAGLTCNNCARKLATAAQKIPGVHSVSVDATAARATVRWRPDVDQDIAGILAAIAQAGFAARELSPATKATPQPRWPWNLILGLSVTGCLMTGEWGGGLSLTPWFQWVAFLLAGGVQVGCGARFYASAWRQLKARQSSMDTLVALGSTTAFGYSAWALFANFGGHLYFMESAAIISLVSLGHWLEARVSDQAGRTLASLLQLAPSTARKLRPDPVPGPDAPGRRDFSISAGDVFPESSPPAGNPQPPAQGPAVEVEVPVAELKINDHVVLRPGDRVPVDGVVMAGESAVDESMLTGESAAVEKTAGGELYAGAVNQNGRLVMRVTATGEATALAQIVAAVQRAQTSRADIQRLGDRISNVFVPVIVLLALTAGLGWDFAPAAAGRVHEFLMPFLWPAHAPAGLAAGFVIAAAVLIIACPCAMGLATPAAIMAGANAAARHGILIRDGVALEKAGGITTVIFDKTGTLTSGRPEVVAAWSGEAGRAPTSSLALALARPSSHPVSRAVARFCEGPAAPISDWKEIRGAGLAAQSAPVHARTALLRPAASLRLGSLRWLRETGVDLAAGEPFAAEWLGQGATVVGLACDNGLVASFAIRDALKPGAAAVVAQLRRQNLKTFLVTGDHPATAVAVARAIGLVPENVFAGVRPEQKADLIGRLQRRGERVAFVGDGINDAPALTRADLGIAVCRASDVAREAADILLLRSGLEAVPEAVGLARATLRIIRQNLFWAFFYNALGVPLAALGFISPVFCALAMGISDLIVIGNALRLLRWRLKP
jgi:Cu+-exporting ATPase